LKTEKNLLPPVNDIMHVLATLRDENALLKQTVSEQRQEISRLNYRLGSKEKENHTLKREITGLREKLSHYEKPFKTSHNSSTPPSQDPICYRSVRRTVSLREKSGLKRGGQAGHPGYTLQSTPIADHIIEHIPQFCRHCGRSLPNEVFESLGVRQVVDVLKIKPVVSEHRIYGKQCICGCYNKGVFPQEARSAV
jgi:regulator of replication initiation timing